MFSNLLDIDSLLTFNDSGLEYWFPSYISCVSFSLNNKNLYLQIVDANCGIYFVCLLTT